MLDLLISSTGLIVATLLFFFLLELALPARRYHTDLKISAHTTNALIFGFNTIVTFLLSVGGVWLLIERFAVPFVVDVWEKTPEIAALLIGFLILDVAIWAWHKMNHEYRWLWLFHQAHHTEQYLNSSSALRFHVIELLLSVVFKSVLLILTGIPLWVFFIHETAITLFAIFHHANIRLPEIVEKYVRLLFVSPRMHYAHHSTIRSEHNANYGVVFSWWDYVFKTYNKQEPLTIGLSYTEKYKFIDFLAMPWVYRHDGEPHKS